MQILSVKLSDIDRRRNLTTSPTDELLSPCSKRLLRPKSITSSTNSIDYLKKYDLVTCLPRLSYSKTNKKLLLGSSSASRKRILDELNWEYTQMSPDIDGI